MTLTEMQTALKIELSDTSWSTDELTRAVTEATADVSRFYPTESVEEFTITLDIDDESFTSAAAHGTYVSLAYKPIKPDSETVTNAAGTTTYVRDTDYTMKYREGKITTIDGGDMAVDTAYLISYTVDKTILDISSITDMIRVSRVEYPMGETPPKFVPFAVWGDNLYLNLYSENMPTTMSEDKHLVVYYEGMHTAPAASADGTFPRVFDEIVMKGASAYALMNRGIKELHDALTAIDAATTKLATIAVTETETALGKVATYIAKVDTALDNIATHASAIGTALTAIDTYLASADAALDKVTTHVGEADTALDSIATPLADAKTALDKVPTEIAQAGSGVGEDMVEISTELGLANTALDTVATQIASMITALGELAAIWTEEDLSKTSAEGLLTTGDDYINKVNVGSNVADMYNQFAQTYSILARLSESVRTAKLTEADTYLASASQYIGEANGRVSIVNGYIAMAQERVNQARGYIEEATGRLSIADRYIGEATGRVSMADRFIDEAAGWANLADKKLADTNSRLGLIADYVNQANAYIASANSYIAEANGRIAVEELIRSTAETYINAAIQQQAISKSYLEHAIERRNEFWSILQDKAQYRDETSIVSQRQPA